MEKMTALPKNIRQIGDVRGQEKQYLEDYVMTYIRKKETEKEYLGIFLGERQNVEEQDCVFIRGILEIPKQQEEQDTEEWTEQIRKEMETYFPEWEIQGCCVIGAYPTQQMERLCSAFPEACRLLYHLQEQEESLYSRANGTYERISGYFVFYEQNKKMQEYLAEVFKENSVEKESLPDKAIKSFREKVKEKGLQKSGSMLKLAGSFFAVILLAIGAIAVNHIEDLRLMQKTNDLIARKEAADLQTASSRRVQSEAERTTEAGEETQAVLAQEKQPGQAVLAQEKQSEQAVLVQEKQSEQTQQSQVQQPEQETQQSEYTAAGWQAGASLQGSDTFWEEQEPETETEKTEAEAAARQLQASYVIRQGDTLAEICKRYYGSLDYLETLCEANEIADANRILPGQKIVLP